MFERFSKQARTVVVDAQSVARETGGTQIDTRHLVVVLAGSAGPARDALGSAGLDPDALATAVRADLRTGGLDAEALASLGIDLEAVRRETDATFGPGALDDAGARPGTGHVPFARDAKKALELALRETVRLGARSIDGGHLLLGVLRADCPGGRALERALRGAGLDVATVRTAVEQQRRAA
ncbi:Clp protease N-terminal domain-containing protein [Isoptericola aurantiacus]|uniref:Clp protease N-terminal domain-containing protein n=1 Tax=Isoptericola aurantiacus TaxID=3377839 RepID=UPI00383A6E1A